MTITTTPTISPGEVDVVSLSLTAMSNMVEKVNDVTNRFDNIFGRCLL